MNKKRLIPLLGWKIMKVTIHQLLLFAVLFGVSYAHETRGQSILEKKVSLDVQHMQFKSVLSIIEEQAGVRFVYSPSVIDIWQKVNVKAHNKVLDLVLKELFQPHAIAFAVSEENMISLKRVAFEVGGNMQSGAFENHQNQEVRGRVTDENGEALQGVSVFIKGTQQGGVTDANGFFAINVPDVNAVLIFSFVGYLTTEVSVGKRTSIEVSLPLDAKALDELVVIGYGTQKKVNLTGAVDVISGDRLANRQAPTVSQLLQGVSPGMNFNIGNQDGFQPGAAMDITIRGRGSLNGGAPYVLIDGIPGDLNSINPTDIESISILKDAAASAIYGARAPYGVILVVTKSGQKEEKISVTYSGNVFLNTPPPLPKSLDSYTWSKIQNEAGSNSGGRPISNATIDRIIAYQNQDWDYLLQSMPNWPENATIFGAFPLDDVWDQANQNYANNDWWDLYYGHSVNQKHDVSFNGGSKTASYYFSAGYIGQKGVLNFGNDAFKRLNILGKVNFKIADWWDFSWDIRLANKLRERPNMTSEGDYSFMFRHISRAYPFTPLYDGFGNYTFESHIPSIITGSDKTNDLDGWNTFRTELRPLKGWKIYGDFGYNFQKMSETGVEPFIMIANLDGTFSPNGVSVPNSIERIQMDTRYWTTNIYTSYDLQLEAHQFMLMAGMQLEKGNFQQLRGYKTDLMVEGVPSFQTATGPALLSESLAHNATQGYFSRFTYNYKDRYLFESNARVDGTYVFKEGNRWGIFPSFSLGWNVNQEPFWRTGDGFNALKVRASWGQLGNQNVSPYGDLPLIPVHTTQLNWIYGYGNGRPTGYTSAPGIVNRSLTWETATTSNLGLNMAFLRNRLLVDIDIFERNTTNMIGPSEAKPGVLGASVPRNNNSALRTRGWELSVNWNGAIQDEFTYSFGVNVSDYKSEVTQFFNPTNTLSTWSEGRTIGEIWGFTAHDLYRSQEQVDAHLEKVDLSYFGASWRPGDVKYEDTDGDGIVGPGKYTVDDHGDMSIIGNSEPRILYAFNGTASYKRFDFAMFWRGVGKKDIYFSNFSNMFWGFNSGWWESSLSTQHLDYFRDTPGDKYTGLYEGEANINTGAYWPRPYLNGTEEAKNKAHANTRYLQSARFLRLQHVQLGYTFSSNLLSRVKLQNVRAFLSAENLLTFTSLPRGIDPISPLGWGPWEGPNGTTGRLTYGADRSFSVGLIMTY